MPQRLDRDDAIALARQGKDVWNEWAVQNFGAIVDFSNTTLTDISFAEFQFFGRADFTGATFSHLANFSRTAFFGSADFTETKFSIGALFTEAKFLDAADFNRASFLLGAFFTGATFSSEASFVESRFFSGAYFSGGSFSLGVCFNKAYFRRQVDFSDRKFNGPTFFRGVTFSQVPLFHGASIHQGTEFENIDDTFTDFQSDGAEQRYRTLKLAMGQQQARTEEAAFAALELKARRYRLMREAKTRPFWKRIPLWSECLGYWFWEKCSKSGRGFLRPLTSYLLSWGAFTASYVLPCQGWRGDWWAGIHYAFLKQFPFAAAFRGGTNHFSNLEQALFAAAPPPGWVTALNSAQSLIALTLIFLMGLGIRHKFRLR